MASASWTRIIQATQLQRSSHILSVVKHSAFVYGGELLPRQPRDGHVYKFNVQGPSSPYLDEIKGTLNSPSPRVGTSSATLHNNIYVFSGRGGEAMAPVDEHGSVWKFDTSTQSWELLAPKDPLAPYPQARSYHCSTSNNKDRIFIHAGCPEAGRLDDLWAFDPSTRTWTQLSDAPGPRRGGTSIAFSNGFLYRMNGFDGKSEQGGSIDIYDTGTNTWSSKTFVADGISGPTARSVSALLAVTVGDKPQLITLFGECDPSSLGHQGAGKMLDDVWAYDIGSEAWSKICIKADSPQDKPAPRGWFGADSIGKSAILVTGGLGEANERLDDAWILQL